MSARGCQRVSGPRTPGLPGSSAAESGSDTSRHVADGAPPPRAENSQRTSSHPQLSQGDSHSLFAFFSLPPPQLDGCASDFLVHRVAWDPIKIQSLALYIQGPGILGHNKLLGDTSCCWSVDTV